MSWFKSISERLEEKKRDLEREAAERAARTVVRRGARAVKDALASVSEAAEAALFGPEDAIPAEDAKTPTDEASRASTPRAEVLGLRDAADRGRAEDASRAAAQKARAEQALDAEVDAELAAMKKRLGK